MAPFRTGASRMASHGFCPGFGFAPGEPKANAASGASYCHWMIVIAGLDYCGIREGIADDVVDNAADDDAP